MVFISQTCFPDGKQILGTDETSQVCHNSSGAIIHLSENEIRSLDEQNVTETISKLV